MNRDKILFITPFFYPHKGGAELYAEELLLKLKEQNPTLETDVLCYNSNQAQKREFYHGLKIFRVRCLPVIGGQFLIPNPLELVITLWKLRNQNYSTVITQTRFFDSTWWVWLYAKLIRANSIFIGHGTNYVTHPNKTVELISKFIDRTIAKFSVHQYDKVVVISKATAKFFQNELGIAKPIIINGSIHTKDFSKKDRKLESKLLVLPKTELSLNTETIIITYIGRLIEAKGLRELLIAYRTVTQKYRSRKIHLVIGGSGPILDQINTFIYRNNLSANISVLGELNPSEVKELLSITDIFVNPSYNEGLPRTVLEAAASGCIIVATDVGSTSDIVIHQKTGFLIDPGVSDDLANTIEQIMVNINQFKSFGFAARQHVQENFDWESNATKFKHQVMTDLQPVKNLHLAQQAAI